MSANQSLVHSLFNGIWTSIWPPRCPLCEELLDAGPNTFCEYCLDTFNVIDDPICEKCGLPFDENTAPPSGVCGNCLKAPLILDVLRSFGEYEGALRKAIIDFKFNGRREMVPALGEFILMADLKFSENENADIVVPVPLHSDRIKERGFNQAVDLARPLAKTRRAALSYDVLIRSRPTKPQVGLSTNQRKANVKGAFTVKKPDTVKGKKVILVDDIYTTGNTINECAKVLKKAGAKKVFAVTVARAV